MMGDGGKKFRGARACRPPFSFQQFNKTLFSVTSGLLKAVYFAENHVSKTSTKRGFVECRPSQNGNESIIYYLHYMMLLILIGLNNFNTSNL
jgi:hypothetical protein